MEGTAMARIRLLGLLVVAAAGPSCLNDHDDPPPSGTTPPAPVVLATGTVGPGGGTVQVTSGPRAGVGIVVPAGALASTVTITITDVTGTGFLPLKILDFLVEPEGLAFSAPATITVKYSAGYESDFAIASPMTQLKVVSRTAQDDPEILEPVAADPVARTVTVQTAHLSRFAALLFSPMVHYRLLGQKRMMATAVRQAAVAGGGTFVVADTQPGGTTPVAVGQGSLAAFWSSNSNLILAHSTDDDARNFLGADDLAAGLAASYANIVVYQFKSGRPIAENGNWLYNEIKKNAQPGFRCDILGYSLGGMVTRYAIEASRTDSSRQSLPNYDAAASTGPLSALVRNFITLGTPHAGVSDTVIAALAASLGVSLATVTEYFPGLTENAGSGGTGTRLNAAYVDDPAIRYFLVAGAGNDNPLIPGPDDGLVQVSSATGIPVLNAPEQALVYPPAGSSAFTYSHANLHGEAVPNGIRDQIVTWISIP
jgi:triacylglycerol esterase/lipase EstA (alpha/beta hydrolase family)